MSTIYQRSGLAVIAAAGSNPLYGLPGVQKHRSVRPLVDHAEVGSRCFSKVLTDKSLAEIYMINIVESEWASRAWTYQEAVFSRRRLIFTDRQVIFNCNTEFCLESGITLPNQASAFLASLWIFRKTKPGYQLVSGHISYMEQYCGRSLTKDSDALNAILSTLEVVSETGYYHIWGVPVTFRGRDSVSKDECQSSVSNSVCDSNPYDPKMLLCGYPGITPERAAVVNLAFPVGLHWAGLMRQSGGKRTVISQALCRHVRQLALKIFSTTSYVVAEIRTKCRNCIVVI